jgi:hypothetical protein
MIDLTRLGQELGSFLEDTPSGTEQQFVDYTVAEELGAAAEITSFVSALLNKLYAECFIDESSWTAMVDRLAALVAGETSEGDGLVRFKRVIDDNVIEGQTEDLFKAIVLQNKVDAYTGIVNDLLDKQTRIASGSAWIAVNMPDSDDKDALVEVIQFGKENMIDTLISHYQREIAEAQAILDELT